MVSQAQQAFAKSFTGKPLRFFDSPSASGRQIVCSFSYLQRIGRGATMDVWFPSAFHKRVVERLNAGDSSVLKELGAEWAAIREFSLVQEAEFEEDFKADRFNKGVKDLIKWKGQDGYRVTVVILGNYTDPIHYDELRIHDTRLQREITQIVHMLYLDKESAAYSDDCKKAIHTDGWNCAEILPHVVMNVGSLHLTGRGPSQSRKCANLIERILDVVDRLPRAHVVHDVAVGIVIPDHNTKHRREKIVDGDEKFTAFQRLLSSVFERMDPMSLGALQGTEAPHKERARHGMMQGFGLLRASDVGKNVVAAQFAARRHVL